MTDDFFEDERTRKFMDSTARALNFVLPQNDRDAELMSTCYIGMMGMVDIPLEDIAKIAIGLQKGYKELLMAVIKHEE